MNPNNEIFWLKVVLAFTIALLLIAVIYTNATFNDINRNLNEVDKATQTIRQIRGLETSTYRTDDLVRLFLLTHDYSLLKNQYDHTDRVNKIKALMAVYPAMSPSLDSLSLSIANQFVIWNNLVTLPEALPKNLFTDSVIESSKAITQNIMAQTSKIKDFESNILDTNSRDTREGVQIMTMLVIVSILFGIALFLFAFLRLNAQIKREALVHEQLQRKNVELDRSNKELEQFAYVASHDLQEPLRKIHAYSGRLVSQEKANLSPEGKEIIDKLQGFAQRMQRLIDDLLTFSRILQHTMEKKNVDLNRILSDTRQTMSAAIRSSDADIISDPLPSIMGFESQLRQLFQNLISNSIKYRSNERPPRIIIKTATISGNEIKHIKPADLSKRFHKIAFSDNGIGFDNINADKIFVIFQRLHGRSEYEGTGIGLAICKLVMQNHEGYITASGIEGGGADFIIYFPV